MSIQNGLKWPALQKGTLIKRYKRFLADIKLDGGDVVTAHCPNSGTMKMCSEPGRPVYVSYHNNPNRKLKYTWELIAMETSLVGVNTMVPNRLVMHSIKSNQVPELLGYDQFASEVKVGSHSRLDIRLNNKNDRPCFVEVKNCTLVESDIAYFPDAVTTRGLKHLNELEKLVKEGNRCVMFYLVQRMDAKAFKPAVHIDTAYAEALKKVHAKGVEILVYDVNINLEWISLNKQIPFCLT